MRRLLSFSVFVAMLLPLLAPMASAAAVGQASVPACCRRGGAHHCVDGMGGMVAVTRDGTPRVRAPREMCPYQQGGLAAGAHHEQVGIGGSAAIVSVVLDAHGVLAQVECLRRISFDRSRQKRGPPVFLS